MDESQKLKSYLQLCKLHINKGKYDRAESLYLSCISEFESDFRPYFNYAQLCCLQEKYVMARDLFYEALKR